MGQVPPPGGRGVPHFWQVAGFSPGFSWLRLYSSSRAFGSSRRSSTSVRANRITARTSPRTTHTTKRTTSTASRLRMPRTAPPTRAAHPIKLVTAFTFVSLLSSVLVPRPGPQAAHQIYPPVEEEGYTLGLQQLALDLLAPKGLVTAQGPVPVQHPVAGQARRGPVHGRPHDPGRPGAPGQQGQLAVGGHLPPGDLGHQLIDPLRQGTHTPE